MKERIDKHKKKIFTNYLPNIGDIVLVGDKNIPKQMWKMGRITKLIEGKDGEKRIAKVWSKGKTLTRGIPLLYLLELKIDQKQKEANKVIKEIPEKIDNVKNTKDYRAKLRSNKNPNKKLISMQTLINIFFIILTFLTPVILARPCKSTEKTKLVFAENCLKSAFGVFKNTQGILCW